MPSPAQVERASPRPIADAVAGRAAVILDGGIRTGEDIARAMALGAGLVLVGRLFLWAATALGPEPGGDAAIEMLHQELLAAMGQLGCRTVADLARLETLVPNGFCRPRPPSLIESAPHV